MLDLVSIGDIKLDTFVILDEASLQCELKAKECLLCLEYGAKIAVNVVDAQIAGSAPNVATGLARQHRSAAVASVMGEDGTRQMALAHLKREGVRTTIDVVHGAMSSYSVVLSFKGDRTILTSHIRKVYRFPKRLPASRWMYVGEMGEGYETLYRSVATHIRKTKTLLALNPGSIQIKDCHPYLYELIKQTDVLFLNLEEAQVVSGEASTDVRHLAAALWKLGCHHVVITDGKNGAYHFDGKTLTFCDLFPGKRVEATGAGDAFASGFIGALVAGLTPMDAMKWGSVNATSVVGFIGPTAGLLTDSEIKLRLKKHPGYKTETI